MFPPHFISTAMYLKVFLGRNKKRGNMAQKKLDPSKIVAALISQAKGFEDKKSFDKAIALYKEALKYDPTNKEAKEGLARIESEKLYLLGAQAYVNGDYQTAIYYFNKALKLDPNNEKANEGKARAEEKMEKLGEETGGIALGGATAQGILYALLSSPMYSEEMRKNYLLGIQAYVNEDYQTAIKLWGEIYNRLQDGDPAKKKLLDYINRARKHLELPPMEESKPPTKEEQSKKPTTSQAPAEAKEEPTLFASIEGYDVYVNKAKNPNIDRREGIGPTNLDLYIIISKYEKGEEKTNWEEIIMNKITENHGTYIGALVSKQGKATGVFYITNDGTVHFLTWTRTGKEEKEKKEKEKKESIEDLEKKDLIGDLRLHNGEWLKFTDTPLRNGEFGIYVKKKEEPPTLSKLKKEFEEAGFS